MKTNTFLIVAVFGLILQSTVFAESTFVQTTIGTGCSSVCINNQCTSTCSDEAVNIVNVGEKVSKEVKIDDFNRLVITGVNIEIFKSNDYMIKLDALENSIENIVFSKNNSTLTITPAANKVIMKVANVKIGMPVLKSLRRTGTGAISIAGFEQPLLELELSGTGKLQAKANALEQLKLKASGTINVDMQTSEIKNAEIFAQGVNQIVLNLSNSQSTLSGEISGVSTLEYCGEPINSLLVQGISKTRKIQCL